MSTENLEKIAQTFIPKFVQNYLLTFSLVGIIITLSNEREGNAMTQHIEYLEQLLAEYREQIKNFKNSKELECFWKGACFALEIAIKNLKEGIDKEEH